MYSCKAGKTPSFEAVEKDWIANAVKPFVKEAKQHFKPEAVPMSSLTCLVLSSSARWAPDFGAAARGFGPERQMPGRFHAVHPVSSLPGIDFGGPPIMPPSTSLMSLACEAKASAMLRAVEGAIALRSR